MPLTCPKCFRVEEAVTCERCEVRALDLADPGDRDILNFMLRIKDRTRWTIAMILGGPPGYALGYLGLGLAADRLHEPIIVPDFVFAIPAIVVAGVVYAILRALASKEERRARARANP
ncbi:MAG: hypothetical protein U0324_37250 [Polyangiales bacterium]